MAHYVLSEDQFRRTARVVRKAEMAVQPGYPPEEDRRGIIPFEFRRFELKTEWEAMAAAPDGSTIKTAEAFIVTWDDAAKKYIRLSTADVFEITDPLGTFGGTPAAEEDWDGTEVSGTTGVCWKPHDCPAWEVMAGGSALTPFEAYDDLTPACTDKNVWPLKADLTADTAADKILVSDGILKNSRGYGTSHSGYSSNGVRGLFAAMADGKNHIVALCGMAKRCKCSIKDAGGLASTDSSIVVDNVVATDGGQSPTASSSDELTVYQQLNPSSDGGFSGADNTVAQIDWHEDDDKWYIYDMPCE